MATGAGMTSDDYHGGSSRTVRHEDVDENGLLEYADGGAACVSSPAALR
jgi:hypothetical protein